MSSVEIIEGDLWSEVGKADLILFTANADLDGKGDLVMGRGAALEAKQRWPGLAKELAKATGGRREYGLAWARELETGSKTKVGCLQVKRAWRDPADLHLIDWSVGKLAAALAKWLSNPEHAGRELRVAINYPGIGRGTGGLSEEEVEPILEKHFANLPVVVYKYPSR
jgi:O-acetyl-ADP-ribose deacetylase (regulator of RNase III)